MASDGEERLRLERGPEATAIQLDTLLTRIEAGLLRLPDFQRPMRWEARDKLDLFDSIYRGFPIGTLLLWKRAARAGQVRFGDFVVEANERLDALWIIDGQQRVTTLASSLLAQHHKRARVLLFDLADQKFLYGAAPEAGPGLPGLPDETRTVDVQDLFDSKRAITWMAARMKTLRPELVSVALECGKRLREYQLPVYVVETDDEDVLREIFDRVNRTGRRLDETDVFTALFGARTPDGERLDLGHVARRVARVGFGTLEDDTVLTALRAVLDLPLDKDFTRALSRSDVPDALRRLEAALARTARFLRDSGIPHVALLPYSLIAVVGARFFDRHPRPRPRNLVLLRRWLWRRSLEGKLTGATVGLRQHVDAVTGDEDASVQTLLALDAVRDQGPVDLRAPFRLNTAKSRLAACAMASLNPRDLRTGETLDVATLFGATPTRALPETVPGASSELARGVANRLLHEPIRASDLRALLLGAAPAMLESHAIDASAIDALAHDRIDEFLQKRLERLAVAFRDFFSRQAEYGADDSPALEAIVVDGDS